MQFFTKKRKLAVYSLQSVFWAPQVDRFSRVESQGVWGVIEGQVIGAGSKRFLDSMAIDLPPEGEEQVLGTQVDHEEFLISQVSECP